MYYINSWNYVFFTIIIFLEKNVKDFECEETRCVCETQSPWRGHPKSSSEGDKRACQISGINEHFLCIKRNLSMENIE